MTLSEFFEEKKTKLFVRFLKSWLLGGKDYNSYEIAVNLSSMITHSLIELARHGNEVFFTLDIVGQTERLNKIVSGEMSYEESKKELYRLYAKNLK